MKKLIKNSIQCNNCLYIITSRRQHHFVRCKCGECFVDGGNTYQRIGFGDKGFTDLSEYEGVVEHD